MRIPLTDQAGMVVNVIEYDPVLSAGYQPPDGLTMHDEHPDAVIGATRNEDGTYTPPPEPEPAEPDDTAQRLALLDDLIAAGVVDQAIKDGVIDQPAAADWYTGPETSTVETSTP